MKDIGAAMGRIPSGIFILTAKHDGKRTGMLASWVMQASFEPPMFTVAVRQDRYLVDWLKEGARVALNVLADDEKSMISHFGRGFKPDEEAFANLELISADGCAPILAEALAFLEGTVAGHMQTGDHIIFSVVVENGRILRDGNPMIHVRKDGTKY